MMKHTTRAAIVILLGLYCTCCAYISETLPTERAYLSNGVSPEMTFSQVVSIAYGIETGNEVDAEYAFIIFREGWDLDGISELRVALSKYIIIRPEIFIEIVVDQDIGREILLRILSATPMENIDSCDADITYHQQQISALNSTLRDNNIVAREIIDVLTEIVLQSEENYINCLGAQK